MGNGKKSLIVLCLGVFLITLVFLFSVHQTSNRQRVAQNPISSTTNFAENKPQQAKSPQGITKYERLSASVVRVIDGDTVDVFFNGTTTRVRLIGTDSPEIKHPGKPVQCFGYEALREAERILSGKMVFLEKDSSQGNYDKYGRLLAYIFLENGSASSPQSGTSFNELMIKEGYAREYTYRLPYKYQKEFRKAESEAKASLVGLWQKCP